MIASVGEGGVEVPASTTLSGAERHPCAHGEAPPLNGPSGSPTSCSANALGEREREAMNAAWTREFPWAEHERVWAAVVASARKEGAEGLQTRPEIRAYIEEVEAESARLRTHAKLLEAQHIAHFELLTKRDKEIEGLRERVGELEDALQAVKRNDKTVYEYAGEWALNRDGQPHPDSGLGARWSTPREIATDALAASSSVSEGESERVEPSVSKEQPEERELIESVLRDPAKHAPRRQWDSVVIESMEQWQARALIAAGLRVPVSQEITEEQVQRAVECVERLDESSDETIAGVLNSEPWESHVAREALRAALGQKEER